MSKSIEEYRKELQEQIAYCVTCQPYDGGSYVWILGNECDIEDLLSELEIPEDLWDQVIDGIACPNCGAAVSLGDVVGTKTEEEKRIEALHKEWDVSLRPEFDQFQQHLERWPYLGAAHPLGKRILESITSLPRIDIEKQSWYRARLPDGGRALITADLLPPNPKDVLIGEGRYNHFGQGVFYLAYSTEAAALEVLQGSEGIAWVQEFIISLIDNIVDLCPDPMGFPHPTADLLSYGLTFGGHLTKPVEGSRSWKPEYFVPRFIADCVRKAGFNGIRFLGTKSLQRNLVLFNWDEMRVQANGRPCSREIRKVADMPF